MVQVESLSDTWTLYDLAYAASQLMPMRQICCGEPRSTLSHWGSLDPLDQRLPGSPSVAADAG